LIDAILLGIIQGLTEFLPISSTAHLTLSGKLLGLVDAHSPEAWTAFIAVMQLGTLAAVLVYFRREIVAMTVAFFRDIPTNGGGKGFAGYSADTRMALLIIIGTLPVALLGYFGKHIIEGSLTKTTMIIVGSLVTLAVLLWVAEKLSRHARAMTEASWRDALIIGFAQALALIPGSSRSGTTITAGLLLGFTREAAARFSFLLSIPAVFASGVYEMTRIHGTVEFGTANLVVATIVAAVTGYAAIAWLLRYLSRNSTMVFVWYRIGLGLLLTVLVMQGVLKP
jgi:undecaprenyl-diphosphatase